VTIEAHILKNEGKSRMKKKKILGWTLVICGVGGGIYVFSSPVGFMLSFLGSILALLVDLKTWILIPAGIAVWWGWKLSHRDNTPGRYSLSPKEIQHEVDVSVDILRCIAERMGAEPKRLVEIDPDIKYATRFNTGKTTNYPRCGGASLKYDCSDSIECSKIRKIVDGLLDHALRAKEREKALEGKANKTKNP